jgi:two-component system alkaline phosphatase synthesis response regulator PhoP
MKRKHTKILLVDDEPDILEIVGYNLTQEGYQILQRQWKEAVAKAKRNCQI